MAILAGPGPHVVCATVIHSCDLSAIVLCGGRSRRFGPDDKALVRLGGRSLLERVVEAAGARADEIVLAVGPTPRYAELGLATALDAAPDLGPLAGIAAGLGLVTRPFVLLVAVDLPLIVPAAIDRLIEALGPADYVIPADGEMLEPLCSLGRRDPLRAAVAALQSTGDPAPRRLVEHLTAVRLPVMLRTDDPRDPLARSLFNVNSPDDLRRAAALSGLAG